MENEPESKASIEFENSLKLRMFEIDLFWKRSWFFGALLIALVGAFYQIKISIAPLFPPVIIAFILMITTLFQCFMNRGSKFWQERWEYMTMNREGALKIELTKLKKFDDPEKGEWYYINGSILAKNENLLTRSRRFSVSKLTFLVWDIIFLCTLFNWINESFNLLSSTPNWPFTIKLCLFYLTIILYITFFWYKGKVYESYDSKVYKDINLEQLCEDYADNKIK